MSVIKQPWGIEDDRRLDQAEVDAQLPTPDFAASMMQLLDPRETSRLRMLADVIRTHMEPQVASRTPRVPMVPPDRPMDHYPAAQMMAEAELMFAYAVLALTERDESRARDFWNESGRMEQMAMSTLETHPEQGERMLEMMMRRATLFYLQGVAQWLHHDSPAAPNGTTRSCIEQAKAEYQRALELILILDRAADSIDLPRPQGPLEERVNVALAWSSGQGSYVYPSAIDVAASLIMGNHRALRQDIYFGLARCHAFFGDFPQLHQAFGALKAAQEADPPLKSQVIADALEQFEQEATSMDHGQRPFIPTSPPSLLTGADQIDRHLSDRPLLIQRPDEPLPSLDQPEMPLPFSGGRLREMLKKAAVIAHSGRAD